MGLYSVLPDDDLIIGNLFIYENQLLILDDVNARGEILSFKYILKDGKPYPWYTLTLTVSAKNDLKKTGLNINNIDIHKSFNFIENEDSISGYTVELIN